MSDNKLLVGGKDAKSNDGLVKKHLKADDMYLGLQICMEHHHALHYNRLEALRSMRTHFRQFHQERICIQAK